VYIDTTTYQWSFGDGDTITSYGNIGTVPAGIHGFDPIKAVDSTRGQFNNPTHTYAEEGDYIVSIVGWNQGSFDADNVFYPDSCAYLSTLEVKIRDSVTTFSATQFGCPQQPILFEIDSLFPLDVGDIFFTWNFGDNTPDTTNNSISISHSFPSVGDYYITLTFIDINGCSFERVDTLTIINPTAIFSMDTNQICVGDTIYFTDLTISDTAIATWSWNFDDGGVSIAKDTSYAFNAKGNYDVQLIVVDSVGCTSSVINSVTVIEPKVIFSADSLQLCAGESTNFTDDSQPYSGSFEIVAWQWDFGNDSTSTLQNPTNTYIADGTYNVALTVTDNQGCVHSDTNKLYIDVQAIPVADFFADVTKMCYDYVDMNSVVFTDISLSDDVTIRWWDFNESGYSLDDSIVYTGAAIYEDPDTFDVSLIVITDYGCRDTLTKQDYIIVIRPEATFSVSPDTICNRDSVLFTITSSSNVDNFSWTFGDGEGNPNADSTTWHMYDTPQSQYVVPGVKLESNELAVACFYTQEQDSIYVHHINADFSLTPISGCVPIEVTFFNASTGNTLAYNWNFDDGSASSSQTNPIYTYDTAGTYNITLTITETMTDEGVSIGCTDDAVKSVVVFPLPAVTVTKGLQVCIGESETLWAISDDTTNSYTYQWSPSTWLNGTTSSTVTLTPQSDQVYTLLVSNNFNCTITESIAVTTFGVTTIDLISDTSSKTIFIGDSLDLSILDTNEVLVDDALYNFVWSPTNYIDCADCNFTEFTGLVTTLYDITVTDIGGICPPQFETIKIIVRNEFAFDLPDLFTPNDDGINDIVYVRGYGIKELQVFEIYNRWGEKVFENTENDLTIGWDGTFNGQPQNMDTYIAVAVVENYHGKTFTIKKHLTLYR
ncbi:MAG: PKD domain-containing protein, partial [Flavobacteriales bacterium]|nr:PKD domain-containing protein [Flavobacteriales bacterium]